MGITSSLQQFMKNPAAIDTVFVAGESTGQADMVCFKREIGRLVEDGLVQVDHVVGDSESWTVAKVVSFEGLRDTDNRSKAVQKTPWRVSLDALKRRVVDVEYIFPSKMSHMTIACVMLDNGYMLIGKSAPADAANFNEKLGSEYALEDALRQMWPLEAYVMRDLLSDKVIVHNPEERWG